LSKTLPLLDILLTHHLIFYLFYMLNSKFPCTATF